jgi:hypothetical protein
VVEDDGGKASEASASTRATTVEPETGTAYLLSSLRREELKTHSGFNAPIILKPPTEPIDRSASPDVALPQHPCARGGEDDYGAAAVASPLSARTPPLPLQFEAQTSALEQDECEIRKIVGKLRVGKGYEWRVRWKDTWLPRSELGNAKRLLREFEAKESARASSTH